jgi:hypothetical protein
MLVAQAGLSAQQAEVTALRAAVEQAIIGSNQATSLPQGARAGHLTSVERAGLRDAITANLARSFKAGALANRLDGLLRWADQIAADATVPRVLALKLVDVSFEPPAMPANAATLDGTYVMSLKQAYDTTLGVTATYGGTYTNTFTAEMSKSGGRWFVTGYTEGPKDFVPDRALESNLGLDPAPGATKPAIPSDRPPPTESPRA